MTENKEYGIQELCSDYQQILDYLCTPAGKLLKAIINEADSLSLESLIELRDQLTDPQKIALSDLTIAYKRRSA